jgi:hypothetical protein
MTRGGPAEANKRMDKMLAKLKSRSLRITPQRLAVQ